MEYLPIEGLPSFIKNSLDTAYGKDNKAIKEKRMVGIQALSGTGSLRMGFEFFSEFYPGVKTVLIPNPSWPNHKNCVSKTGMKVAEYRYYDNKNKGLDFKGLMLGSQPVGLWAHTWSKTIEPSSALSISSIKPLKSKPLFILS